MQTSRRSWRAVVGLAALTTLTFSAVYEAAVALRWISIGDVAGRGAPGDSVFAIAGFAALLAGLVVSLAAVRTPAAVPVQVRLLLPLAAAALVVATGLGFDPYYAPEHVRYPENSGVPTTWWLGVTVCCAIGAAAIGQLHARAGMVVTALVMLVCLGTFVLTGSGH